MWMPRNLSKGEVEGLIMWPLRSNKRSWVRVRFLGCLERTRSSVFSGVIWRRHEQSHWEMGSMEAWKLERVRKRLPHRLRGREQWRLVSSAKRVPKVLFEFIKVAASSKATFQRRGLIKNH